MEECNLDAEERKRAQQDKSEEAQTVTTGVEEKVLECVEKKAGTDGLVGDGRADQEWVVRNEEQAGRSPWPAWRRRFRFRGVDEP